MTYEDLLALDSITFDVTQEDIECGKRNQGDRCPIARAVNRTLGTETGSTWVHFPFPNFALATIQISAKRTYYEDYVSFAHSPESAKFVDGFDHYEKVQPATFTIKRIGE